jgi:hypothetical protein
MCFRSWELEQAEVVWLGYRRAEGEWFTASRRFQIGTPVLLDRSGTLIELLGGLDSQGPRAMGLALVGA